MAVRFKGLPELHPIAGVRIGVACAGIKKPGRRDLTLFELAPETVCAAVFTRNAFCAAPVHLARERLSQARYFLINTGNANAGTGAQGLQDARATCRVVAEQVGVDENSVLPFSTGVIGEPLPVERINAGIPQALAALGATHWAEAAHGIMTTDTVPKGASRRVTTAQGEFTVTGIAKGSGMIRPDMATLLAFVATDAACPRALLQQCLEAATQVSFNCITVDGDTSTNDACVLLATGAGPVAITAATDPAYLALQEAVTAISVELAQAVVRDGEGATKFITVEVHGGATRDECAQVAYAVAQSPLVKTAFFAGDPNWGRILAAVGRAGLLQLDLQQITIHLNEACIVRHGGRAPEYTEEQGRRVMAQEEITIRIALARGAATARVWTCDFSYDYVKINAEYRT